MDITDDISKRTFAGLPTMLIGGLALLVFYAPILLLTLLLHLPAKLVRDDGIFMDAEDAFYLYDPARWYWNLTKYTLLGAGEYEISPYMSHG